MPANELARILVSYMTRTQLREVLERISDAYSDGCCPLCGEEDYPVDRRGRKIKSDDVSKASEWRERHDEDCPVTIIEKSAKYRNNQPEKPVRR